MKSSIKYYFLLYISKSPFFSKLYYFVSGQFDIEMMCVINGRSKYFENEKYENNVARLRRDVHRLEKGLVMIPMKKVFALSYIEATVDQLIALKTANIKTRHWASSVIGNYFELTDSSNDSYNDAKNKFINFKSKENFKSLSSYPKRKEEVQATELCSIDVSFNNLVRCRRSVRHYEKRAVNRDIINQAVLLAIQSPTACNRVPYRYYISDKAELSRKIASCAGGTVGFLNEIEHVAVLIADFSNYMYEVDRHAPFIDGSLSAMTFIYSLESKGVSSVAINWHEQKERRENISKLINIEKHESVIMLVGFGYMGKQAMSPYSEKKDLNEVLIYAE
jgi:nitroreductase